MKNKRKLIEHNCLDCGKVVYSAGGFGICYDCGIERARIKKLRLKQIKGGDSNESNTKKTRDNKF